MTNWREQLRLEMARHGESADDIVDMAVDGSLDEIFDDGYGGSEGCPITVWTENRVYFPVVYDGTRWLSSVSRNPDGVAMKHVGG